MRGFHLQLPFVVWRHSRSVDSSRACAIASIGIYGRLRFSQLFINNTLPLSIRLLLFASIKSRMFTKSTPVPNKHLFYLSLVWYSVSPPSPHLVEKEWCERRQRGIHRVLNYLPRIVHLSDHHLKIESPHHFALLSEDTQPITALSAFSPHLTVLTPVICSLGS